MIRIAVVGTRSPSRDREPDFAQACRDYDLIVEDVWRVLAARLARGPFAVVTGGAYGVDRLGEAFALKHSLHCVVIEPDYDQWGGKVAPIIRNGVIANECDGMIAWPKRTRGGTDNALEWAEKWGRPVVVRRPWDAVTRRPTKPAFDKYAERQPQIDGTMCMERPDVGMQCLSVACPTHGRGAKAVAS